MKAGIAFIPEERRAEGLILNKSIAFNFGLANLQRLRISPAVPLMQMGRRGKLAAAMMQQFQVKAPNADTPVGRLSGGNQQKVVIGKWLSRQPRVLILDEPTRGVDIGARAEIHRLIRNLAADGVAVIVISSEAEELPEVCDRVLVMAEGRVVRELAGAEMTRANIVQASYSEGHAQAQSA
jgi:ABC-type sugar transport system ATPase subunit